MTLGNDMSRFLFRPFDVASSFGVAVLLLAQLVTANGLAVETKSVVTTAKGTKKRPNVLVILTDDQSPFDLKVYDPKSALQTPTIDRLAAEGMVFDGAYHMGSFRGAVCTPSRHMIMTGRTVWHLPNVLRGRHCPDNIKQNVLAAVFNRAGYKTMRTCKKGNSYRAANEQFTVVRDATKRGGTAESGSAWHGQQVLSYLSDREANEEKDPFLIYFGFSHPHDKRDGTPDLLAKYGAVNHKEKATLPPSNSKQPKLPINYLPQHPFHHGHPNLRDEVSVSGVWKNRDQQTIRNELGRQFACSENIDMQISRVLQKLDAMEELDNTYIVYTSDHGMAIGRHGLQGKQNLYEHTWRVPLIIKGPGIEAGKRKLGNAYLLDLLPTLCDLTGIEIPKSVEGLSLKPVLKGTAATVRDTLYGVYSGGTKPGIRSVKKGVWKLIKYDVMQGAVQKTQLFNLKDNPDELLEQHHVADTIELTANTPKAQQVNLAGDPKHAEKLAEMEALLLSEMRRLDDPHRLWNQPDDGLTPSPAKSRKKNQKKEKPNVIVIFTDDQGYNDLGCFGSKTIKTPYLDRLAKEGRRFTNFHVPCSVCSPSRAALLTGCYPKRIGMHRHVLFPRSDHGLHPQEHTIADQLRSVGYATACIGKWHLGRHPETLPRQNGFDSYYGIPYSNDMNHPDNKAKVRPDSDEGWINQDKQVKLWNTPLIANEEIIELPVNQRTITRRYTDKAIEFVTANKDKPFFLYLPHSMPHIPLFVPEDVHDPDPKNAYKCVIEHIDAEVGRLVQSVRDLGLAKKTYIVFTSDNGPWIGFKHHGGSALPLRSGKGTTFEGGQRVPCIMWAPDRIPAGTTSSEFASTLDLLPTIASLADSKLPKALRIDGHDLTKTITGDAASKRNEMIYYSPHGQLEGLRQKNWKLLVKKPRVKKKKNVEQAGDAIDSPKIFLFDLAEDVSEKNNLAEAKPDKVQSLQKRMIELDEEITKNARPVWRKK